MDHIPIKKFIRKVIKESFNEQTIDDLYQYILLTLLEYDNMKLNKLMDMKLMNHACMRIILNQRNGHHTYYQKYIKLQSGSELFNVYKDFKDDTDKEELIEKNDKIDFILKELKKYVGHRNNLTDEQVKEMLMYEVYRFYIRRDITINELAKKLKVGYNTVYRLIRNAREKIKQRYDDRNTNNTDNYFNYQ